MLVAAAVVVDFCRQQYLLLATKPQPTDTFFEVNGIADRDEVIHHLICRAARKQLGVTIKNDCDP